MMGLCKSCFSSKYPGGSPEEAGLEDTAALLLAKPGSASVLVTVEPSHQQAFPSPQLQPDKETAAAEPGKLERCETGDSGTDCVAEQAGPAGGEEEGSDPDLVQLTVSSLASCGPGLLEDVPEHCELGADSEQATTTTTLSLLEPGETATLLPPDPPDPRPAPPRKDATVVLKPVSRPRTASFGSGRSYSATGQPVGHKFIIHAVNSKTLLNSAGVTASGVRTALSRQTSRNSSISGPATARSLPGSRPPSRPGSRPPSRPASRPGSRAPSPETEDSLSELPVKQEKQQRFSVIGKHNQIDYIFVYFCYYRCRQPGNRATPADRCQGEALQPGEVSRGELRGAGAGVRVRGAAVPDRPCRLRYP